uniref:(northern house mosquito) hypothetical protein n=1 Tax=Culex pipiens TaxID=7175 RepID=A0A8D8DPN2_CULPI
MEENPDSRKKKLRPLWSSINNCAHEYPQGFSRILRDTHHTVPVTSRFLTHRYNNTTGHIKIFCARDVTQLLHWRATWMSSLLAQSSVPVRVQPALRLLS